MQTWTNFPADAEMAVDRARISPGDAVPHRADPAEFLDIEMDELTGMLALIAAHRLGRFQVFQPRQAGACQHPAHRRLGHAGRHGDVLAGQALPAQRHDRIRHRGFGSLRTCLGPRGTVDHADASLGQEAADPARHHLRRHPVYPRRMGFGNAAFNNVAGHLLSTQRRQTGILVDVHSVLRESLKLRQPQLSRSGPNGQPPEGSQLERTSRSYYDFVDKVSSQQVDGNTALGERAMTRRTLAPLPAPTPQGFRLTRLLIARRYAIRPNATRNSRRSIWKKAAGPLGSECANPIDLMIISAEDGLPLRAVAATMTGNKTSPTALVSSCF